MRSQAKSLAAGLNLARGVVPTLLITLVLTFLAGLWLTADAHADQTYVGVGSFATEGSEDGQLTHPRRIAVEDATGNVFVVDRDNDRVQVFSPTENAAGYLTQFGAGTLSEPFGIAIDQASGNVYVSDAGNERIVKFSSDGALTPSFSVDATFTSPAKGGAVGQIGDFEADLAVDPTSGNLIVGDPGNDIVQRFEADGTFVSSFDGATSPDGSFTGLLDLDVAPNGDVYVVDSQGPVFVEGEPEGGTGPCINNYYCVGEPSRVLHFGSGGGYQGAVQNLESTSAGLVAVDPNNGQILVGLVNPQGSGKLAVYGPEGKIDTVGFPNFFTWFPSLAVQDGGSRRLYVATDRELQSVFGDFVGEVAAHAFTPLTLPTAAIDPVGVVDATSAQVSGTVNPEGTETGYRFEYRSAGSGDWLIGPTGSAGAGSAPVAVSGGLTGLQPNTAYEVRLVVNGAAGKDVASSVLAFTTEKTEPLIHTRFAAPRTTTTARINGYVNPRNDDTSYYFEWGATATYGNTGAVAQAGNGGGQVIVAEELTGLQPNTTYHYRLVAENDAGVVEGEDLTFTTRTAAEMAVPRRGIELVNPPDKGNQNPGGYLTNAGDKVVWSTLTGTAGASLGKGALFLAERAPSGWSSRSMLPRPEDLIQEAELGYGLIGTSRDHSKLLFKIGEEDSRGIQGDPYYFSRFDLNSEEQQQLDLLPEGVLEQPEGSKYYASEDARHLYLPIKAPAGGSPLLLYDIGDGTRRIVSVLPETGEPPACGIEIPKANDVMSKDGSRFFFVTRGGDCNEPAQIYLFDNQRTATESDDTIARISTPALSGPEAKATPLAVTDSGDSLAYYTEAQLTPDDTNSVTDVYRWTLSGGNECVTCVLPDPGLQLDPGGELQNVLVSDDLSHLYFGTRRQLLPGLGQNGENLYLIADEQLRYVSPGGTVFDTEFVEATADGRVVTFRSPAEGITADDNSGLAQLYRYGAADGSVECLSCPGQGPATHDARSAGGGLSIGSSMPADAIARGTTVDGETHVFVTGNALLPEDVNAGSDVYEWHNGKAQLITDGEGEYDSSITPLGVRGISPDGTNVLFNVSAQLTGHERDDLIQLYVARIGGGFPPPSAPTPCDGDACQGPLAPVPAFVQPGSGALAGPGNEPQSRRPSRARRCAGGPGKRAKPKTKARCKKTPAKRARHGKRGSK